MTPVWFVLAAATAALGRQVVGHVVCTWQALLVVNTLGSALLGYVGSADLSSASRTIIGVGFCGAFTTYSSFALEVHTLGWRRGSVYAVTTVACACAAASIGTTLA